MAASLAARAAPLAGARPAAAQRAQGCVRASSSCSRRAAPVRAQLHAAHGGAAQPSRREAVLGAALLVRRTRCAAPRLHLS
jgi:hypothetical protein